MPLYELHTPQNEEGTGGLMSFTRSEKVAEDWHLKGGVVRIDMTEVN